MKLCIILFSVMITGCLGINTTRKLEKKTTTVFTNRLEGTNTGLSSKLDLQGYFRAWEVVRFRDTLYLDLMFYEDGSSHYNFFKPADMPTYDEYFRSITEMGKNDLFYKGLGWGVYRLSGDTIKMQQVSHASNLTARFSHERWFLIEDRHTLRLIADGQLGAVTTSDQTPEEREYKFHPLTVIPPSIPWLKKEKFFWRNPQDWEQYMQMIKVHH